MTPLARARVRAHKYLDLIWKTKIMTRSQAYKHLLNNKHIGEFSTKQCNRLVKRLKNLYPDLYKDNVTLEDDLFYP